MAGQREKNDVTQQLQTKIFLKVLRCNYRFYVPSWCDLRSFVLAVIIRLKVDILKEGTSHWPDNDEKTMSQSKFKLKISERALGES